MSSWTSYSYINLAARGMDSVSYLGCAIIHYGLCDVQIKGTSPGQYYASARFNIIWVLIPVADIKDGVLLRGDALHRNYTGAQGIVGSRIITHPDLTSDEYLQALTGTWPGRYLVRFITLKRQNLNTYYLDRIPNENVFPVFQASSFADLSVGYVKGMTPGGTERPFSWDATTGRATFKLSVTGKTLKEYCGERYEYNFSGNILNIADDAIITQTFEMNCPAPTEGGSAYYEHELAQGKREVGDPITAPLFKIPIIS